jgi:hypothetical protein
MTLLRMSSRKRRSLPLWNTISKKSNLVPIDLTNTSIQNPTRLDPSIEVLSQNPGHMHLLPNTDGYISEESTSDSEIDSIFEEPCLDSEGKIRYSRLQCYSTKDDCSGKV